MVNKSTLLRRLALFLPVLVLVLNVWLPMARAQPAPPERTLNFAVLPYQSPRALVEIYEPLVKRMEQRLERPVRLITAPDIATLRQRALAGSYDFIIPPNTMVADLVEGGYRVVARGMPSFRGGVIVRQDSSVKGLEELRGRTLAAVGRHSYGGYLFLRPRFEAAGIDPDRDLKTIFGSVDTVLYGVINGQFDSGVVRLDVLQHPRHSALLAQLRVIEESVDIPQFPFMVAELFCEASVAVLVEELMQLSPENPDDLPLLNSLGINRMEAATFADYHSFIQLLSEVP